MHFKNRRFALAAAIALSIGAAINAPIAWTRDADGDADDAVAFVQTNLDSNVPDAAAFPDANLTNAWGLAFAPGGAFWVNANHSGNSNLFKGDGSLVSLVVTNPAPRSAPLGTISSPTGILSNPTTAFFVPDSQLAAAFIFGTEDGTISAWNPKVDATHAVIAVDNSPSGAVYAYSVRFRALWYTKYRWRYLANLRETRWGKNG